MKKKIIYIMLAVVSSLIVFSCKKDLNVAPQNIIQNSAVFANESAITAYFASLYNELPIEDFDFHPYVGFNVSAQYYMPNLTDESINCLNDDRQDIGSGISLGWWGYTSVRNVNQFIAQIPSANFTQQQKNQWLGEAKFILAYYYFAMVKRYGGVPLITTVENYTGSNLSDLQVPRNTEKDCYDFIAKTCDEASALLPATSDGSRANKYTAFSLKSRAMLYAASEAEYGSVQLNGLVGIESSEAQGYWQKAYDAADSVMASGKYVLYNSGSDKTTNFTNAFIDAASKENIFVKEYQYPAKAHSWDLWVLPHGGVIGPSSGYGSRINPTLELVNSYENIDGTDGTLKLNDANGNPIVYSNPSDVFATKDPRLNATIMLPFSTWKGTTLEIRAGIIDNGQTITSGNYNDLYNNQHIIGQWGIGGGGEISQTGFYVRKYLQPATDHTLIGNYTSTQSFIEFRYAEILLNYAEAAVELGKTSDAMTAVNLVRDRAGIKELTAAEVTRDRIRHERLVEFAIEPNRYWDLKRWHIYDKEFINRQFTALLPYEVLATGGYEFKTKKVGYPKTFTTNMYYERIDPGQISTDPKLVQNPGY